MGLRDLGAYVHRVGCSGCRSSPSQTHRCGNHLQAFTRASEGSQTCQCSVCLASALLLLCLVSLSFNFEAMFVAGIFCPFKGRLEEKSSFINCAPALRSFNVSLSEKLCPFLWKMWFLFHLNGWGYSDTSCNFGGKCSSFLRPWI